MALRIRLRNRPMAAPAIRRPTARKPICRMLAPRPPTPPRALLAPLPMLAMWLATLLMPPTTPLPMLFSPLASRRTPDTAADAAVRPTVAMPRPTPDITARILPRRDPASATLPSPPAALPASLLICSRAPAVVGMPPASICCFFRFSWSISPVAA